MASILRIDPPTVSKIVRGQRGVHETELQAIASYIEEPIPPLPGTSGTNQEQRVTVRAGQMRAHATVVIAPFLWKEKTVNYQGNIEAPLSSDERLAGIEQYVAEIQGDGRLATCVPFHAIRQSPISGDCLHVRRTRGNLVEDTLRWVRVENGKISLQLEKTRDALLPYPPEKETYEIVGIVVGMWSPLKF